MGLNQVGTITGSYADAKVSGESNVGGLVGSSSDSTVNASYYDSETTKQNDTGKGEPRSTAQMTYPPEGETTYVGWDFDHTWDIQAVVNDGYPYHQWQEVVFNFIPEGSWADGDRYVSQGNWATYTAYQPNSTVNLYAGQRREAGTGHFSESDSDSGEVTITIALNEG